MTRLIIVDLPSGNARLADPKSRGLIGGDLLHVDPEGRTAPVASQNSVDVTPSVKQVDLATGKARVVEKARLEV